MLRRLLRLDQLCLGDYAAGLGLAELEGNTYSRLDTCELIEHGRIAQGKDAIEIQMILNHKAAIELLVENLLPNPQTKAG